MMDLSNSVSVVIPVYMSNADDRSIRLLERALQSVFDQVYPGPYEILVVDDGSPTPVRGVLRDGRISESTHIRWFRSARNRGIVHALNSGLARARYKFIARLDADDRWLPGKIAGQLEAFQNDEDLSLIAANMQMVDSRGSVYSRGSGSLEWNDILYMLGSSNYGNCVAHGSILALGSVFRLLGGYSHDLAYRHCEDYHLWSIWARFFHVMKLNDVLYEHREFPNSGAISDVYGEDQKLAANRVLAQLARFPDRDRIPAYIHDLGNVVGLSGLQCGAVCYRLWRYKPVLEIPRRAVDILRSILPDRDIAVVTESSDAPVRNLEDMTVGFAATPRSSVASCKEDEDKVIIRCLS